MPTDFETEYLDNLTQEQHEELLAQINNELLWQYLEIDDKGYFTNAPSTDDELHEFIILALGYTIPRKVIEPGHSAPFAFIADLYFERVKNVLAFANRTGGKTLGVSILNFLDMLFKPGCEIASCGAVRDQAKKAHGYFLEFMDREWVKEFSKVYQERTGRKFLSKILQEHAEFGNGSVQQIITATERGLRSPHPHKARIDEIDLIDWDVFQTGLSMARSTKKGHNRSKGAIKGQNVFTSTRQNEHGSMQRLLDEADEKGIKVYEWNIWEAVEKCERKCQGDPVHGDCPIYVFCQGKAHDCAGFYPTEDFVDKVRLLDKESWEVEWLNQRPAKGKLVYNNFDKNRHVMTPERLRELSGYSAPQGVWRRVSGMDFGASPGHPFVYLKLCQLPTGEWLIFHEYVKEQASLNDHAFHIKKSPFWLPGETIYSDHASQERIELKNRGIRTIAADKEVFAGINYVRELFSGYPPALKPQLYVWHECTYTIMELQMYQWRTRHDGKPDISGLPEKKNDHCLTPDTKVCIEGSGWVDIGSLEGKTGRILTPAGFKPYEDARCIEKDAEIWEIEFEDGSTHRATKDHNFLTDTLRYASMEDLTVGDTLLDVLDGSQSNQRDETGFQRKGLLSLREVFQQREEARKRVSAQGSVGTRERRNSTKLSHTSFGRRQSKQFSSKLRMRLSEQTLKRAYDTSQARAREKEYDRECDAFSESLARNRRGENLARSEREDLLGEASRGRVNLSAVSGDIHSQENKYEVLQPSVQTEEPTEETEVFDSFSGSNMQDLSDCISSLAEGEEHQSDVQQQMHKTISKISFAGYSDVWCLGVPGIHCFVLDSGIVSKNCMDSARYALYSLHKKPRRRYTGRRMSGI